MTSYLDASLPTRSEHLWRYTPWSRVHPTKVDELPAVGELVIESEDVEIKAISKKDIEHGQDIARIFLDNVIGNTHVLTPENKINHVHVKAGGHAVAAHIHIESKQPSSVMLHLTGEAEWVGLWLTGSIHPNSQLSVGLINELSSESVLVRTDNWKIERDGEFELATLSLGGQRIKSDIRTILSGSNSTHNQFIAVHGHGTRHDDHHIEIHHQQPHTNSKLTVNAACDDRSHSVGTGALTIDDDAQHTDAGQIFRNLLLSESARAEAIPELEVMANEVAAAHGAASAPIDAMQMHYLMSRGLSKEEATSMLVEGFLVDSFVEVRSDSVREAMQTRLTVHLECQLLG
ncbi:MAG: SufD family Fe-S cluster assembly protein [Candidatus Poseidoniaceae archaeon]|nr:SufD family Fe-S cluster assembly protein [Candidatus Poseidoniaceae archaeon]